MSGKENRLQDKGFLHWQMHRMKFQNTYSACFPGLFLPRFRLKAERQPPFAKALQATTMRSSYKVLQELPFPLYNQEVYYYEQLHLLTISICNFPRAKNTFFSSDKQCTVIITFLAAEWKQWLALQWPWSR